MVLTLDPGIRGCGIAMWVQSAPSYLFKAFYVRSLSKKGNAGPAWQAMARAVQQKVATLGLLSPKTVVIEIPRVYPAAQQKGDQNDLIPLAGVGGLVCGMFPVADLVSYYPRDWKGTVDADAMIERIKKRLSATELNDVHLPIESLAHNVWDAIGIGLHYFGRLAPIKVFSRGVV